MSNHDELLEALKQAVQAFMEDGSVLDTQKKKELEDIRDDLEAYIDEMDIDEEDDDGGEDATQPTKKMGRNQPSP